MNKVQGFLQEVFSIDANTSATILISILVFVIGLIITWFGNSLKNFLKRKRRRKQFRLLIESISNGAIKQAKNFSSSLPTFKIDYIGYFTLKNSVISQLDNIDKINLEVFFEAYFSGIENLLSNSKKRKAFNRTWGHFYHLKKIETRYTEQLQSFISKFNKTEDLRNESLDIFFNSIKTILQQVNNANFPPDLRQYVMRVDRVFVAWQTLDEENRTHYFVVNQNIVEPIFEINKDFINDYSDVLNINNQLLLVKYHYENMENQIKHFYKTIDDYSGFYRLLSRILKYYLKKKYL